MRFPHKIVATVFYVGYIPFIPGTISSVLALLLYYSIKGSSFVVGLVTFACLVLGFLSAGKTEALLKKKDPRNIVIDEFSGMLIALFLLPPKAPYIAAAFFLFRFFDILKIPPMKRLEELKGGKGIMFDDIAAGLYTNLLLQIVSRLF